MQLKRQEQLNYLFHDTEVENLFISDFAVKAPGEFVKVYLLALMHAKTSDDLDNIALSKMLDMPIGDIEAAWDYWEEQGVIKKYESEDGYDIEFVNLKEAFFGGRTMMPTSPAKTNSKKLEDERIQKLYKDIQQATGRLFESKEAEAVATWLYNFEIDPSVILLAYKYCTKNRTSNRYKYVEKVLLDWKKRELSSVGDIEEFLGDTDKRYAFYKSVLKELGFMRNPTEPEKRMMDAWMDEYEFTEEEVMLAIKKTTGISNPNLNYVNSVLRSFREPAKEKIITKVSIEDLYQRLRDANEEKLNKRREEVFAKEPRMKEVLDEMRLLSLSMSKCILRGDGGKEELAEIRNKQKLLQSEKEKILKGLSLEKDYLEQIYTCPKCKDTGYLIDGTKCECFANMVSKQRILNER